MSTSDAEQSTVPDDRAMQERYAPHGAESDHGGGFGSSDLVNHAPTPRHDTAPAAAPSGLDALAHMLATLGHPDRLRLIQLLAREGELTVAQLVDTLGLRQPAVSQHLGRLRELGIVKSRRVGKMVLSTLVDNRILSVIDHLSA